MGCFRTRFAPLASRFGVLLLAGLALGCIHVGPAPQRPALSNDPSVGPAACYSECTLLGGCVQQCGYVAQPR